VEIIQWFVKVGDKIQAFDRVCEVQSDKATVEISSRYDGEVIKIYTEVGGIANVGKPLIDLLKPADAAAPGAAPAAEKAPSAPGHRVPHLARTQLGGLQ
jgi:2-oxoisovalerate dehydrogenase E2 component (dihydrolipoyl transacylase)